MQQAQEKLIALRNQLSPNLPELSALAAEIENWPGERETLTGIMRVPSKQDYTDKIQKYQRTDRLGSLSLEAFMQAQPHLYSHVPNPTGYVQRVSDLLQQVEKINELENALVDPISVWTEDRLSQLEMIAEQLERSEVDSDEFPVAQHRYRRVRQELDNHWKEVRNRK